MRVPFVGRDMLESSDCMCMYTCIKGRKEKRKGKKETELARGYINADAAKTLERWNGVDPGESRDKCFPLNSLFF